MALEIYRKKRRFAVTPEPRGRKAAAGGHLYVIQKHAARRLHYDLRLELDGVMKSWAVTRGPSLDPSQKRLAVHVEDHPIEYNSFEGTIPEGEYGGGTVMVWDRGTWTPDGDPHKAYAKGHLVFDLNGEKLHGRWHLVRMRGRDRDRRENWLLIKARDDEARGPRDPDILQQQSRSAATGRSIEQIAAVTGGKKRVWHSNRAAKTEPNAHRAFRDKIGKIAATPPARARAKSNRRATGANRKKQPKQRTSALPDFVPLSLATLSDQAPAGREWLHEIKLDGYRMQARLDDGQVQLLTRKRQDWTHRFGPVAEAVGRLPATAALLDGEIVVENARGISDFSLLQADLRDGRTDRFIYYVFDLLHLDGRDLLNEPLFARKAALAGLVEAAGQSGAVRYTGNFDEAGPVILRHACEMGLEGIISKRRDAAYRSDRSDNFIKTKCRGGQEVVVVGYSPSAALPNAIGALTIALHQEGKLRYAGRVGTGYSRKTASALFEKLQPWRTARRPIELPADERRKDVVWVKPQLVIEVQSAGMTHGGVLRQAAFKGIREDKTAGDAMREVPAATPSVSAMPNKVPLKSARRLSRQRKSTAAGRDGGPLAVHLTHPDRVYWPDVGVTKADLAEYYVAAWDWMKPHILGRALSLVRAPGGVGGETFFQKHIASTVKSSPLRRVVPGKDHDVIAVQTIEDLVALVQSGALEIHVRGSRLDSLETCDRIVFDLDPGEGVSWPAIVAAAREVRERLDAMKLASFVKLSGGKGIHVALPIVDADWDIAKLFAQRVATAMAADSPKRYLAKMTKSLRQGRIFIDYFRNSREATSIAAYSTRARAGAPVSAPVTWERLSRTGGGNEFSVLDLKKRLKEDAWAEIVKIRQRLPAIRKRNG